MQMCQTQYFDLPWLIKHAALTFMVPDWRQTQHPEHRLPLQL